MKQWILQSYGKAGEEEDSSWARKSQTSLCRVFIALKMHCKCLTTESKSLDCTSPVHCINGLEGLSTTTSLNWFSAGVERQYPGTLQEATPPGPTVEEVDGPVLQTSNLTYSYVAWLILHSTSRICLTKQVSFAVALKRQINEIEADNLRKWTGWESRLNVLLQPGWWQPAIEERVLWIWPWRTNSGCWCQRCWEINTSLDPGYTSRTGALLPKIWQRSSR